MSIFHGYVALDMRQYDFGLRANYYPSDNPTLLSYSTGGITTRDPVTLSTKSYTGSFDISNESNLLANSTLSGMSGYSPTMGPLFDAVFFIPVLLSQVLSDLTPPTGTPSYLNGSILQNILNASPIYVYGSPYADYLKGGSYGDNIYGNDGNDSVEGGGGADYILGGLGNNFIAAGDGDDKVYADTGDDWLSGGFGNDYLNGGGGNDKLGTLHLNGTDYFCSGNDSLDGGAGQDTLDFSLFDSAVIIDLDAGTASGSEVGNDTLAGIEHATGGAGNDSISGDENANSLVGNDGNDTLIGAAGNDSLEGDGGTDSLLGGTGNDHYHVTDALDSIVELTDEGTDLLYALVSITMGANIESATLGGSDSINCTGNELANTIVCNDGNNSVSAMNGNDTVSGGLGNDWLHGNIGEDVVYGEDGADTVMGGKGNDSVFGEADNDLVRGGENNDSLFGGDGNDTLLSGKGEDLLSGGAGDDSLDARLGNDTMTGGDGNDIFLLASTLNGTTNVDTITDFTPGTDEIWLHPGIFTALAPQYGSHVSLSANLLYDSGTGVLSYDADGAGGGAAVAFANVGPGLSFTGTDFFVGA